MWFRIRMGNTGSTEASTTEGGGMMGMNLGLENLDLADHQWSLPAMNVFGDQPNCNG